MEWFKFRMCWRKPILTLTNEEAGEVMKALVNFLYTEEDQVIDGRGDVLLCQIIETLQGDLRRYRDDADMRREKSMKANRIRWDREHAEKTALSHGEIGDPQGSCGEIGDPNGSHGENRGSKNKKQKQNQNKKQEKDSEPEKETDTEAETEEERGCSSVLPPAVTELPVLTLPLINGTEFPVFQRDVDEYAALYPDVNVVQELRNMRGWCLANPTRRKTKRGIRAFINTWLKKAQQEAERKPDVPENPFLKYATGEADIGEFLL